jgi:hypothetical protein
MKTPLEILHKYFHHFKSERTRDLVVRAMEDYAKIYHETEVKKLQQHSVMQGLPYDCLSKNKVCELPMNSCRHCAVSGSPTVGKEREDASVSDGK